MVVIGEKLGLYKALASGAMSSAELAARTQTDERYLRGGSLRRRPADITYDKSTNKFSLSGSKLSRWHLKTARPICRGHSNWRWGSLAAVPQIADAFRTGAGMGWHEHVDGVFHGCEKFFRQAMPRTW